MDFNTAITLQGYLEKESPNMLRLFQKRYFTYRNKGEFLVWFKRKPNSIQDQPKGFIKIIDILQVIPNEYDDRLLELQYPQRTFILRAETKEVRDRWVKSIEAVKSQAKKMSKAIQNKPQIDKSDKGQFWRWQQADDQQVRLIRLENQKLILNEGEDSVHQNSKKFQAELMKCQLGHDLQHNAVFGYFNRKSFLKTQTRWYFMCSEFNLYDEGDQEPNLKLSSFLQHLQDIMNGKVKNAKEIQKDNTSDSEEQKPIKIKEVNIKLNCLYQFNIQTKTLLQTIPLVEIVSWTENTKDPPFSFTLKYIMFNVGEQKEELDFTEEEKQLVLYSNYLTEIKRWTLALKIISNRYSLAKQREKLMEERFVRYRIKMFRTNDDQKWRVIGTEEKPQFAYLNREQIKVGGFTYKLEDVTGSFKTQKIKNKEQGKEDQNEKEDIACRIGIHKQKLTIVFFNTQDERAFRKRAKKFVKKLEPYLQQKKSRELKNEVQQINLSTYYLDKKIRQDSSSIKINFYQVLQQDNPVAKKQRQHQESSFFDRFLSMFCSPPIEEEGYF